MEEKSGSRPSKETLKERVERLSRGEKKEEKEPEEPPATKKSIERLEEKISETEKKSAEYLDKLNKLSTIDETVSKTLQLENAKANLPKLKSFYQNFDMRYPAPHPNDFETGNEYLAAQEQWKFAKDEVVRRLIENDKIVNPDRYKEQKTEPKKDPEFEAEVVSMEKSVPGLAEAAKIVDGMPEWQRDMVIALPPGTRSLVAHCFGKTFSQEQVAAMSKEEFTKQYRLAVDYVQKSIIAASAAAQPPDTETGVKAPPKITEGAPPPERRENLKEKAARVNGSFYHR